MFAVYVNDRTEEETSYMSFFAVDALIVKSVSNQEDF